MLNCLNRVNYNHYFLKKTQVWFRERFIKTKTSKNHHRRKSAYHVSIVVLIYGAICLTEQQLFVPVLYNVQSDVLTTTLSCPLLVDIKYYNGKQSRTVAQFSLPCICLFKYCFPKGFQKDRKYTKNRHMLIT